MQTFIEFLSGETYVTNEVAFMRDRTIFRHKRGANSVIKFRLSNANKQPVNLDGSTVTVKVSKKNSLPVISGLPCSIGANQAFETGRGTASFVVPDESKFMPKGEYLVEFTVIDENGLEELYPNNEQTPFAKLLAVESLEK